MLNNSSVKPIISRVPSLESRAYAATIKRFAKKPKIVFISYGVLRASSNL
jgi:hypothetical protein